jgi:hypothetical protein
MTDTKKTDKGDEPNGSDVSHRFHHPEKPNTCKDCGAHVTVLKSGSCLVCCDGVVTPTDKAIENDWTPEKHPEECREVSA